MIATIKSSTMSLNHTYSQKGIPVTFNITYMDRLQTAEQSPKLLLEKMIMLIGLKFLPCIVKVDTYMTFSGINSPFSSIRIS